MMRPLEGDCALQLVSFDDPEGKETFWHSSAHMLGEALELEFGVDLTIGPPIEEGFYYDCHMGDATLNEGDLARVEKRVEKAIKVSLLSPAVGTYCARHARVADSLGSCM
eukprot:scaffold54252_cov35-Prasinocladus_malaysianus.AAC.1